MAWCFGSAALAQGCQTSGAASVSIADHIGCDIMSLTALQMFFQAKYLIPDPIAK